MAEPESNGPFSNRRLNIIIIVAGIIFLAGYPVISIGAAAAPSQNACDGVLRTYGRCETGTSGADLPLTCCTLNPETFPTVTSNIVFPVPFTNAPTSVQIDWLPVGDPHFGSAIESDIVTYAVNTTRSGSTCIECSKFIFPSAGSLGVVPASSGWLTAVAGDGFLFNNFPTMPTNVLLEMNIVANSNATANGRTFIIQGFDPFINGVDCTQGLWENVGIGPVFQTNFGAFDVRGALGGLGTGASATVNGTLLNDLWLARNVAGCATADLQLRVVGTLTSGHETTTYSKILIAFFYTFNFYNVNVIPLSINTASFSVQTTGPYGGSVSFSWKAVSETG